MRAIEALKHKIAAAQKMVKSETEQCNKVYGKDSEYFYTFTKAGTRIDSSFFDWCCMEAEITNYQEQEGISEEEAISKF